MILTDLEDFTKDQNRFGFSVTESLSLGVTIDENLTWEKHIAKICKKAMPRYWGY